LPRTTTTTETDGDDFELVVSLAEQQRQVVLDEIIAVLADYDDDGNGRRRDLRPDAPVVAEPRQPAVAPQVVMQLDEEKNERGPYQSHDPVRMDDTLCRQVVIQEIQVFHDAIGLNVFR